MCARKGEVRFKSCQARRRDIVPVEVIKNVHEDHHREEAEVDFADKQAFIGGEVTGGAWGCFVVLAEDEGGECVSRRGGRARGGFAARVFSVVVVGHFFFVDAIHGFLYP